MEVLLKKIEALVAINDEIIARVEATEEVKFYEYILSYREDLSMEITAVERSRKVAEITQNYTYQANFGDDGIDIFNDRLQWISGWRSWEDLKALNARFHVLVGKFRILDPSSFTAQEEVQDYLKKLEVIQVGLGGVEEIMMSSQSHLQRLMEDVKKANEIMSSITKQSPLIVNGGPPHNRFELNFADEPKCWLDRRQQEFLTKWYGKHWKLAYSAREHGWGAEKWHSICDDKGATITIVVTEDGLVFGGYLSVSWSSKKTWLRDRQASLFTLKNNCGVEPTKFEVFDAESSGYGGEAIGPSFGAGADLRLMAQPTDNGTDHFYKDRIGYSYFPHSFRDSTGLGKQLFTGNQQAFFRLVELQVYIRG